MDTNTATIIVIVIFALVIIAAFLIFRNTRAKLTLKPSYTAIFGVNRTYWGVSYTLSAGRQTTSIWSYRFRQKYPLQNMCGVSKAATLII